MDSAFAHRHWAFSPSLQTLLVFLTLETLWIPRLCKRCCFPNLVSSFLLVVIVIALRPEGATSTQPRATPWVLCNYELFALQGQL